MKLNWIGGINEDSDWSDSTVSTDNGNFNHAANWKLADVHSVVVDNGSSQGEITVYGDYSSYFSDGETFALRKTSAQYNNTEYTIATGGVSYDGVNDRTTLTVTSTLDSDTGNEGYIGVVPRDSNSIEFSSQAGIATDVTNHTAGKHWNCISNLDQSSKQFDVIRRLAGFTGNLGTGLANGSAGDAGLKTYWNEMYVFGGDNNVWSVISDNATGDHTGKVIVNADSSLAVEFGFGDTNPQNIPEISGNSGSVVVYHNDDAENITLGQIDVTAVNSYTEDFWIQIGKGAVVNQIEIVEIDGIVNCFSDFTDWKLIAGAGNFGDSTFYNAERIDAGTIHNYGGTFNWYANSSLTIDNQGGNTIAKGGQAKEVAGIDCFAGEVDLKTEQQGTITKATGATITQYRGGLVKAPDNVDISW